VSSRGTLSETPPLRAKITTTSLPDSERIRDRLRQLTYEALAPK
jgi:hypothetical protein